MDSLERLNLEQGKVEILAWRFFTSSRERVVSTDSFGFQIVSFKVSPEVVG